MMSGMMLVYCLLGAHGEGPQASSRKLPVWELRLVPHEVSLGLWGRVGGAGGANFR